MSSVLARLAGLRQPPGWRVARMILYIALYVALAWISFVYPMRGLNITPWNPHAAMAVGLLLWQPRTWWLVWIAIAAGDLLVFPAPQSWPALLLSSGALCAGYVATAVGLKRWIGPGVRVLSRRDVVAFLLIVGCGTLAGALLRAVVLWALGFIPPDRIAAAIHPGWIGDGVGVLVILPLLLVLASRERTAATRAMLGSREAWLIGMVTVVAVTAVFARPAEEQFKLFYLLFLPVVWAAARFGAMGAVWSAALVQLLLIFAVQASEYRPLTVFELQLLMAVLASTALLLGATVDEREEAQRALRASLRLAAAGDMAAALAHELNQPLTAMSTYARASQLVAAGLGSQEDPSLRRLVAVTEKLVDEASRAGEVVNRLRKFFRDRATELQPVDLATLLSDAVRSQQSRADALHTRLDCACEPDIPPVWLDPVQIGVVLRNLLANGLEAASDPRLAATPQRRVSLSAAQEDGEVVICVDDSAPGLQPHELSRVFENRISGKPGGMGVGLAISRSIVEAHGGRLWAEPGPGGKFRFSLPLGSPNANE